MNLLYGEMAASFIGHWAIPMGVSLLVLSMNYMLPLHRILLFIGLCVLISFACQFGFLAILQSVSCGGVQDYGSIATGSAISALITGLMISIPAFIEPMRLVVSQLFGDHRPLLTPEMQVITDIIKKAGVDVAAASSPAQKGGASISPEEYEKQTFQEITTGSSFWAAFAGAYGIGIGSLLAAKCSAQK